jgi:hypothetical protein
LAVVLNDLKCVKALLCAGTRVNPLTKNIKGWNALHYAVQHGAERLKILEAILDNSGKLPEATDKAIGDIPSHMHQPIPTPYS